MEKAFPHLKSVELEAQRIGIKETIDRAKQIYELLEMLCITGRLNRANMFGDVTCLDVGGAAPEVPIFLALDSKSITATEFRQVINVEKFPEVRIIYKGPIEALKTLPEKSVDLITMFNTIAIDLQLPERRLLLIEGVARALRPEGELVISGEKNISFYIRELEKELSVGKFSRLGLRPTLPKDQTKPMWGRSWAISSILAENALGFDYDRLGIKPDDKSLDSAIMVVQKMNQAV